MKSDKRKQQYKQLGLAVAYYRKMHGLTQLQLAEECDLSRTHISNLEAPNMPTSISLEALLTSLMYWKFPSNVSLIFRMPPANKSVFKSSPVWHRGFFISPHPYYFLNYLDKSPFR